MKPVQSQDDLNKIKSKAKEKIELSSGETCVRVFVEMGSTGIALGARRIFEKIVDTMKAKNIQNVEVITTGGSGCCAYEPIVRIKKKGVAEEICYTNVTPTMVDEIIGAFA